MKNPFVRIHLQNEERIDIEVLTGSAKERLVEFASRESEWITGTHVGGVYCVIRKENVLWMEAVEKIE